MMGSEHLPFVVFGDDDASSDAPRIILELEAETAVPGELSLTLPYRIFFKLRRARGDTNKSCIFRWSPYDAFVNADIVLLHMTEQGPERVHVDPQVVPARDDEDTITVTGWNQSLDELTPSGELKILKELPIHYQKKLKAGETYQLLWPGGELNMWDWGSKAEHVGKELKSWRTSSSQKPKLILPASEPITFTAKEESEPWPERPETTSESQFQSANRDELRWRLERNAPPSPSPLRPSDRVAGAPILSLDIDCPREWTKDALIDLKIKVTYEDPHGDNIQPITFHTTAFRSSWSVHSRREGTRLYQHLDGAWKEIIDENGGFGIFDDPPIPVNVGDEGKYSDQFATLRPGESWNYVRHVQGSSWTSLPYDVKAEDRFKFIIKGAVVDWWDSGTKEDHKETAVKLPCFVTGDLEEPTDNGGRPKLVVPASNEVFFTYVG